MNLFKQLKQARKAATAANKRIEELEEELSEWQPLEEELEEAQSQATQLQADLEQLQAAKDQLQAAHDELRSRNGELQRLIERLKNSELREEVERLTAALKTAELEHAKVERELVFLRTDRALADINVELDLKGDSKTAEESTADSSLERERKRRRQAEKKLAQALYDFRLKEREAETAQNNFNLKTKRLEEAETARQAAEKARAEAEWAARSAQAALAAAEAAAAEERARWDQLLGGLAERAEQAERQREEAQALLNAILDRPGSDPETTALKGRVRSLEAQLAAEKQKQTSSSNSTAAGAVTAGKHEASARIRALREVSLCLVRTVVKQLRPVGSKSSKTIEIEVDRGAVVESAFVFCEERRLLEQLRQPTALLKIAIEEAVDRKGPSREFYALFFEELVKNQLLEEPMQGAQGVLPPAVNLQQRGDRESGDQDTEQQSQAPAQAPQRRRNHKRIVVVDSEDEDESGADQCSKRSRLEGGQPTASTAGSAAAGGRRSGRSSSQHVAVAVVPGPLTKYQFIGSVVGRALLERILDPKGTDPIPAALVPMLPLLSGRQPDACATAEEALALWKPFLGPEVHGSMARILAEPVSPEAPVPMDPYLQGCPAFSGDREELTEANKRHLVRLAAQWQCVGRRQPLLEAMREGFQGVFTRPEASKRGPEAAAGAADALEAVGLLGADDWAALVGGQAWTAETLIANMRFHSDWRHFQEDRALIELWLFGALRTGEVDPSQFARCIGRASAPASGKLERPLTIAPKTYTPTDGTGRKCKETILLPWSDKEWGLAFHTCSDEMKIPGVPSAAAGAEEERRRLFVRAVHKSVDVPLDFNDV
eukprot:tig00000145_g8852.t1